MRCSYLHSQGILRRLNWYWYCSTGSCTLRTIGLRQSNERFLSQAFTDIILHVRAFVFWEMKGRFGYSTQRADCFQNPQALGPAHQVTLGSISFFFPLDASLWQKTSCSHRLEDYRNMPPSSTTKKIRLKWEEFVILLSKVRFLSLNFLSCTLLFLRSLTI